MTAQQLEEVKTSTLKEIQVLNMVKGHASISTLGFCSFWDVRHIFLSRRFKGAETMSLFVPFSHTHWFLWVHNVHISGVWPVSITTESYIATVLIIPFEMWVLLLMKSLQDDVSVLVFICSMRRGELFDYLTEKVTLSEKETRWAPASVNPIALFSLVDLWHLVWPVSLKIGSYYRFIIVSLHVNTDTRFRFYIIHISEVNAFQDEVTLHSFGQREKTLRL